MRTCFKEQINCNNMVWLYQVLLVCLLYTSGKHARRPWLERTLVVDYIINATGIRLATETTVYQQQQVSDQTSLFSLVSRRTS